MRLILASASPRRLDLLKRIGIVPDEVRPGRDRRGAAQGRAPHTLCGPNGGRESGGDRRNRHPRPGRRHGGRGGAADPAQDGRGGRSAGGPVPSVRTPPPRPFGGHPDRRRRHRPAPPVDLDRRSSSACPTTSSTPTSPAESGAARPAAMPSRAGPRRWSAMVAGSHSGVVGLPLFETRALLRAAGYPLG